MNPRPSIICLGQRAGEGRLPAVQQSCGSPWCRQPTPSQACGPISTGLASPNEYWPLINSPVDDSVYFSEFEWRNDPSRSGSESLCTGAPKVIYSCVSGSSLEL